VLDILAYQTTGVDPIIPDFSNGPYCPYSNAGGCLMPPRYRPMTCVIFNCDLIEDRLTSSGRDALLECEQKLRDAICHASLISTIRLDRPFLLIPEQLTAP
jgi:hypothetical protein